MTRSRHYRWLAVLPPLAMLVGVPFVNGVQRYVLGLPLLLFWIVACVLCTSVTLGVIARLDHRRDADLAKERMASGAIEPESR